MRITVNGDIRDLSDLEPDTPLLWALRDVIGLTGTKYGCGIAACGACTVFIDDQPVRACQTRIDAVGEGKVVTIEGLAGPVAQAVQEAWTSLAVAQCGYCQSGQVMSAVALLRENRRPSDADIDSAMAGNLCRCATYNRIRAAIHQAARALG